MLIQPNEAGLGQEATFLETFLEKIILLEETNAAERSSHHPLTRAPAPFFSLWMVGI